MDVVSPFGTIKMDIILKRYFQVGIVSQINNSSETILGENINNEEFYAFIELLLITGLFKTNHEPILN